MQDIEPTQRALRVSPADIGEGNAFLELPFVGKLLLAHWMGAPWSDKDPDAFLHATQVEAVAHKERERIIEGASRLGKSVLGGVDLCCAMIMPNRKVAIVAKRYDHVAHEYQYLHGGMKKLFSNTPQAFKRLTFKHQANYHDYDCETIWGSRARGFSVEADEGASLLGQEFTDIVLGEGSHIDPDIFEKKALRASDGALMERTHGLAMETGKISIYTTPKGYEGCSASEGERVLTQTGHDPSKLEYGNAPYAQTVWLRSANILENPAYSRDVFEARRASMDKIAFREQYLGEKTYKTGAIYPDFDPTTHVVSMPTPEAIRSMRLGVGMDTGAYSGVVLAGIDKQNKKWILGEVYAQKPARGIYDVCEMIKEMIIDVLGPAFDTEDFGALKEAITIWSVDPASQHKMEIIDLLDIAITGPVDQEQKRLLPTIEQVGKWIAAKDFFVVESCTSTIDQIKKYIWRQIKTIGQTKSGSRIPVIREPKKEYDHLLDALRFVLIPMAKDGPLDEPPPVITLKGAMKAQRMDAVWGPLREMLNEGARRDEEMGLV